MVSTTDFQKALITYLKTYSSLTSLLTASSDIKEDFYRGATFNYPAIRVDIERLTPNATSCFDRHDCRFRVLTASELDSSDECARVQTQVVNALNHKILTLTNVLKTSQIFIRDVLSPVFLEGEERRLWISEIVCECIVIDLT